jgi:hypothetical protein
VTSCISDDIQIQIASPIILVHIVLHLNYCRMEIMVTQDPVEMALL